LANIHVYFPLLLIDTSDIDVRVPEGSSTTHSCKLLLPKNAKVML